MSLTVTRQYEPGVIYDIRQGAAGTDSKQIHGLDYVTACHLLAAEPPQRQSIIPDSSGGFGSPAEYENPESFNGRVNTGTEETEFALLGGLARRRNGDVVPGSVCFEQVRSVVSDAEAWTWFKVSIWKSGANDGFWCLGVKPETKEAIAVSL